MKKQDDIGIIFVNSIAARGLYNNVVNMSFSAFNFTPNEEGSVDPDPVIVCRLRMDKGCLIQLQQVTEALLKLMDEPPVEPEPQTEGVILKSNETSH